MRFHDRPNAQRTQARVPLKVLFVCMGNICRSPTAEGVMQKLIVDEAPDLNVEIDSAGTHAYHVGEPPDRRAQAAARRRGVDLSSLAARAIKPDDFEHFDYVLAMDETTHQHLVLECPVSRRRRVRLFLDFAYDVTERNVPDPYFGGVSGFERVLDLVEDGARGLLAELIERANQPAHPTRR